MEPIKWVRDDRFGIRWDTWLPEHIACAYI